MSEKERAKKNRRKRVSGREGGERERQAKEKDERNR